MGLFHETPGNNIQICEFCGRPAEKDIEQVSVCGECSVGETRAARRDHPLSLGSDRTDRHQGLDRRDNDYKPAKRSKDYWAAFDAGAGSLQL